MFCLRHYGKDASGKRTTINYFSTKAVSGASTASARAGVVPGIESVRPELVEGQALAEASTTTVCTVISGEPGDGAGRAVDEAAGELAGFEGLALDAEGGARGDW